MIKTFKELIAQICIENSINYKFLSKDWVIMLEKNGNFRFISGYKFDLNPHGMGLIADDKYALYEILNNQNIPVAEHKIVYNKTNNSDYAIGCNTYEYVKDYFEKNNNHIVLKPNCGTCGNNVFNVTNVNELNVILDKLFLNNYSISICPFYSIKHEYRIIMLNNECKLIYEKSLPIVIGDGNKTIRELLLEFNYNYFKDKLNDVKYDKVLSSNEIFEYNWKFNLSQGAISKKIENSLLTENLIKLAKQVCLKTNLKFGSIDIINTTDNKLLILEVNSGVMLENYVIQNPNDYILVKSIYTEAINSLF